MLTHPKATGDRSTLAVMVALYENEIPFLLPLGENMRYDLVLEFETSYYEIATVSVMSS
jgi:hypothetical protein